MDYIKEIEKIESEKQEIINKAKQEGYIFVNNLLIKSNEYMPVIEVYVRGETLYESAGRYFVFKNTIPLTREQVNEIIKYKEFNVENIIEIMYNSFVNELKDLDGFYEILDMYSHLEEEHINYITKKEDLKERYHLDKNQNLYMEFYFQDSYNNMNGFVSIFDMRVEDLEDETKESDIFLVKYLKDN